MNFPEKRPGLEASLPWSEIASHPVHRAFWESEKVLEWEAAAVKRLTTEPLDPVRFHREQSALQMLRSLRELAGKQAALEAKQRANAAASEEDEGFEAASLPRID